MRRRSFLGATPALAALLPGFGPVRSVEPSRPKTGRAAFVAELERMAAVPLATMAEGRLRSTMPVEAKPGQLAERRLSTHLECQARLLAGLAPWLELDPSLILDEAERRLHARFLAQAQAGLINLATPGHPDAIDVSHGRQPLVDTSFLALALLRAPRSLWEALPATQKQHLADTLKATRRIEPYDNNWHLFSALIEAALHRFGYPTDAAPVQRALDKHAAWYKGDGRYGDGPDHHEDYYNSYVIQPYLLMLEANPVPGVVSPFKPGQVLARAQRHAQVLERMIAPDGTFPPLGRSLPYRCGAFQLLAQLALEQQLPGALPPGQARQALRLVIQRSLQAKSTYDAGGWLTIGLFGHQPGLGEVYISTGSLYLASGVLLPLGLAPSAPFWAEAEGVITQAQVWGGEDMGADGALKE